MTALFLRTQSLEPIPMMSCLWDVLKSGVHCDRQMLHMNVDWKQGYFVSICRHRHYRFIKKKSKTINPHQHYRRYRHYSCYSYKLKMALARSWSDVGSAHIQAITFLLTKTLSRSRSVVWCVVWCVVKLGTLSLLLSLLPLLCLLSFSLSLSFCLFLFFLLSFSFYSLFSSLPFTPTNTVQSTDQQTRRPTSRRLNVMWRTVRSKQLPTNCTERSHLSSSLLFSLLLLPPPSLPHQKEEYFWRGIYFYYSFKR